MNGNFETVNVNSDCVNGNLGPINDHLNIMKNSNLQKKKWVKYSNFQFFFLLCCYQDF